MLITIDEIHIQRLQIDGENTWFEQESREEGIFLRIHRLPKV
jgi:hypothetical protein